MKNNLLIQEMLEELHNNLSVMDMRIKYCPYYKRKLEKIKKIVLHCSDTFEWTPERLRSYFLNERRYPDCGYHYFITKNGIFYMVDVEYTSYHAKGYNNESIGVAIDYSPMLDKKYDGKYKIENNLILLEKAKILISLLANLFDIRPIDILGHRELFGTGWMYKDNKIFLIKECPGDKINLNDFRNDVEKLRKL